MYDICRDAARHRLVALRLHSHVTDSMNPRMPLSFHAVSFGPENRSTVLRRMVEIAQEVENSTSYNSLIKGVPSSFTKALDTVSVECFSLQKLTSPSLGRTDSDIPRVSYLVDEDPWCPAFILLSHV
jgi:hypothetical protein